MRRSLTRTKQKTKTYPTPHARTYALRMYSRPASFISRFSPDPRRVIGLFLVKLFAYLRRLQASGQTVVPNDIAHMVSSADAMVNGYIRTLAVKQLKSAGYASAARALRVPKAQRSNASAQINMEPVPVAELIERLQTTIETFERADAIASLIARVIVCVLACGSPGASKTTFRAASNVRATNERLRACPCPPTIIPVGQGPPCGHTKLRFAVGRRCTANRFAEIPPL